MKKSLSIIVSSLAAGASLSHAQGLVAGWDTWADTGGDINPATQVATGFTASADGTPATGGSWIRFSNATVANGGSDDGTFGTVETPAADTGVDALGDGYTLANGYDGHIDFTLTNTTDEAIALSSFNFDAGAFRVRAARNWELSVLEGGAITSGSIMTGGPVTVLAGPITDDYDVDLTVLEDNELEPAGSVTFRLNFTGGGAPGTTSAGHHLFLDNVAIFGGPPTSSTEITDVTISSSGEEVVLSFTAEGTVDIYRSTDLQNWGEVYASGEISPYFDEVGNAPKYFYLIVPTGQGLPQD